MADRYSAASRILRKTNLFHCCANRRKNVHLKYWNIACRRHTVCGDAAPPDCCCLEYAPDLRPEGMPCRALERGASSAISVETVTILPVFIYQFSFLVYTAHHCLLCCCTAIAHIGVLMRVLIIRLGFVSGMFEQVPT